MVPIPTTAKIGFLRQICAQAKAAPDLVKNTLIAAATGHFTPTFSRGRLVVSQSGSGQSGSFQLSTPGGWNQNTVFELIEELIQIVDFTGTTDGGSIPDGADDASIDALFAQIVLNYNQGALPQIGIREQMGDFSGLNFPATSLK